jgi:cyclopropane fatty-acyl-phospholipid synthase-like methyltransferase
MANAMVSPIESRRQVTGLYDWLSRFNLLANKWAFGSTAADLTMHKTLRIPEECAEKYRGANQRLYIVDLALEAADLPHHPSVLDAGCGFGGTVFRWHDRVGGTYDGLTLSRVQWKHARRQARLRGIEDRCRFHLRSYDEPAGTSYDAVVSIEALIHSPSFEETLRNLAAALKPSGKLVIVEDIPLDESRGDSDLESMRRFWGLSEVPTASRYRAALTGNRFRILHDRNYSDGFQTAPPDKLARLDAHYSRAYTLLPLAGPRFIAAAFLGGLALERLYQKNLVQYRLIVAQRED